MNTDANITSFHNARHCEKDVSPQLASMRTLIQFDSPAVYRIYMSGAVGRIWLESPGMNILRVRTIRRPSDLSFPSTITMLLAVFRDQQVLNDVLNQLYNLRLLLLKVQRLQDDMPAHE